MKREIGDYVEDIVDAMEKAMKFVEGMSYDELIEDDKTVFAVIRALEIIGEEEISMEEAVELDKLAKETREKGVEWEKLKARLDL